MGSTFIPSRCAHIDTMGTNVLIRGNMPLVGPDLHYALDEIEKASGVLDLRHRQLIEVPIIDNVGERQEFAALLRAFALDPDDYPTSLWPWWEHATYRPNERRGTAVTTEGVTTPGALVWRPFEGLPPDTDPRTFLTSPGWDFDGFIENVVDLMVKLTNAAVYVHCQLGADRTGAFHIGYLMNTLGLSLEEASQEADASTSAGAPNADYQRLVAAYARSIGK